MTSPPYRLGAHDGAAPLVSQFAQPGEATPKRLSERVIRVVMKALVFPERVDIRRDVMRSRTPAAQGWNMFVTDGNWRQCFGKHIAIVLRICARARHLADIGDHSDLRALE